MTYYCNTGGQGTDPQDGNSDNTGTIQVTAQNTITGVGATSDNATIISRMQQRRGLKQDLPQPLRPGEIGFTTDSQQVFIGADPEGAPSFNKTSVFENTLNSRVLTESILANQVFEFRLPFRKYARGEFSGVSNSASWLPTSFYKTGISDPQERVFSDVFTDADTVFDARDGVLSPRAFQATDLVVKKNSMELTGNNTAQYATLVADDFTFQSGTQGNVAHSLTFRTRLQASDEITVSYYDDQVVPRVLEVGNNAPSGHPDEFLGFYEAYDVPAWDQIDPELISYSDTTGRGFLGLEFKHISVRATGNVVATPNNLSLGTLHVSRNHFNTSDTGNIVRSSGTITGTTIDIPVGVGHEFSNTGARSSIVVSAGADFVVDPDLWIDGRPLDVVSTTVDTVTADISIAGSATRTGAVTATAVPDILEVNVLDTSGIVTGDTLYFYGAPSSVLDSESANVLSVANSVISVSVSSTAYTDTANLVSIPAAQFVNYGNSSVGSYVQVMAPSHGLNAVNSPDVVVVNSTDTGSVASGVPITVDYSISSDDWIYVARVGDPTLPLDVVMVADEPLDYGVIAAGFSWWDDLLTIDLSGASSLAEASAIVNDLDEWPRLEILSGTNNQVMLTQNPSYDSVGREFIIYPDPAGTAVTLGLTPGTYTLSGHTLRANLERWFQAALNEPNLPVFNQVNRVGVNSEFYADPSEVTSLGTYEIDIDETFNEIRFGSREEAIAFNTVVNNLYFRARNSDIRGLVNIKSNLELEIKQNITIGDKTVSYVDMNVGNIGQTPGHQPIPGLTFSTSDFNVYVVEYSVQEAQNVQTVPGANYARVGTMKMLYRRNFDGLGNSEVAFYEDGSDIVDTGGIAIPSGPILEFSAAVDSTDPNLIQVSANNQTGWPLTIKYIVRRWNSAE